MSWILLPGVDFDVDELECGLKVTRSLTFQWEVIHSSHNYPSHVSNFTQDL